MDSLTLVSAASILTSSLHPSPKRTGFVITVAGEHAVGATAAVSFSSNVPFLASSYGKANASSGPGAWIFGALAFPAPAYMLQDQEVHAAELECTFIAIKPDGVQRGLISEIISRFERKGYKLVGIKGICPEALS